MRRPGWVLSIAIFSLLVLTAQAQDKPNTASQGSTQGPGSGVVVSQTRTGVVGGVISSILGPGPGAVRGMPFSADTIDEQEQFLADGNRIHHEQHGKIFRDSEGRTRTEIELGIVAMGSKGLVFINIFDPVERKAITLNPEQKTATVVHFEVPTGPMPRYGGNAQPARGGEGAAAAAARQMQSSQEDLGTMEIEGFLAHGTRFVSTIPAGTIGNDKPMTNSHERWFSEDLKTDLLMKTESPQSGKHVHKLVNIRSGDPDPLLFQVPPDYTVEDKPQR
jgi:hypothetical protein